MTRPNANEAFTAGYLLGLLMADENVDATPVLDHDGYTREIEVVHNGRRYRLSLYEMGGETA